ncbi:CDP-alcohol phosphatidyltransferase family protein [Luteolibacter sp. LG18]|uniref:CDP-alcohol phosphatidyltransferase family protein n=1 Tax=Luteolibacter sp. LG18 TaxID=2819286 RepID=UPI002B2CCE7B|nr:CDP-diacylglycerol--glycerol-3-phosphate 3-phosphatidyltransferase [Luteolibacter sp. LG18]
MTLASKITLGRLCLVPVFAVLAVKYGHTVAAGQPVEALRWWALATYIAAAASDGIDGWIARRFNQRSRFGEIIDPIADKSLLLTGIITLSVVDWGPGGWRIPWWFCALAILRDLIILGGITILFFTRKMRHIGPRWIGKVCTVSQMFALGWVMLKWVPFDPLYPCLVAAFFTAWSGYDYLMKGIRQLRQPALDRESFRELAAKPTHVR